MSFQKIYGLYDLNCHIVGKGKAGCDFSGFSGSERVMGECMVSAVGLRVVRIIMGFHKVYSSCG